MTKLDIRGRITANARMTPRGVRVAGQVWAYVTLHPSASLREIATGCEISLTQARYYLLILRARGYITYVDGASRARRVLVPLYLVQERR